MEWHLQAIAKETSDLTLEGVGISFVEQSPSVSLFGHVVLKLAVADDRDVELRNGENLASERVGEVSRFELIPKGEIWKHVLIEIDLFDGLVEARKVVPPDSTAPTTVSCSDSDLDVTLDSQLDQEHQSFQATVCTFIPSGDNERELEVANVLRELRKSDGGWQSEHFDLLGHKYNEVLMLGEFQHQAIKKALLCLSADGSAHQQDVELVLLEIHWTWVFLVLFAPFAF